MVFHTKSCVDGWPLWLLVRGRRPPFTVRHAPWIGALTFRRRPTVGSLRMAVAATMAAIPSAKIATLCTIGPGLEQVGAVENYGWFSPYTKLVMCVLMSLGRLEVFGLPRTMEMRQGGSQGLPTTPARRAGLDPFQQEPGDILSSLRSTGSDNGRDSIGGPTVHSQRR